MMCCFESGVTAGHSTFVHSKQTRILVAETYMYKIQIANIDEGVERSVMWKCGWGRIRASRGIADVRRSTNAGQQDRTMIIARIVNR